MYTGAQLVTQQLYSQSLYTQYMCILVRALTGHVTSVQCTVIVCTLSSPMSMARAYSTAGLSWTTYDLHQSMPCVLTKNSSYVYSNTTLVHTAFFKPTVMKLLVEWKKSLFEWYYWRSSCEVPNHVDRHAVHWEDKSHDYDESWLPPPPSCSRVRESRVESP